MTRCDLERFLQTRGPLDRRIIRLSQHTHLNSAEIAARLGGGPAAIQHRKRQLRRELDAWMNREGAAR